MYEDDNRNLNHMEQNQMPEQNKPERREKRKGGAAKKVAAMQVSCAKRVRTMSCKTETLCTLNLTCKRPVLTAPVRKAF